MITNRRTKVVLSFIVIGFLVLYPIHSARSVGAIMFVLKEFKENGLVMLQKIPKEESSNIDD